MWAETQSGDNYVFDMAHTKGHCAQVNQLVWHPFELVTLDGMDDEALNALDDRPDPSTSVIAPHEARLAAIEDALAEIGEHPEGEFVTASEAARRWVVSPPSR